MVPKFVLEKNPKEILVHLELVNNQLEIVTEDGYYLVSIDLDTGLVIVNEKPEFGLKYSKSIK